MPSVTLQQKVPLEHQPEIVKNLYWLDGRLESIGFDPQDGRCLQFGFRASEVPGSLRTQLVATAHRLANSLRAVPARTIFEYRPAIRGCVDAYEQLSQKGWIRPAVSGTHLYGGLMFELMQALDLAFRGAALSLDVPEFKFPTLIGAEALAQSGYLEGFPQHANFVCHLPEQWEAIQNFQTRLRRSRDRSQVRLGPGCGHAEAGLSPTVCYHFYKCHEGTVIPSPSIFSATAISSCFRYEGQAMRGLRRLREFTMREIVFLGAADRVRERRAVLLEVQKALLRRCELQSVIRNASDPFFLGDSVNKRVFQMSFDLKHEVQVAVPGDDEWLAIGSVNYHQDHFGKAFRITLENGEPAHSCCLGFGLDRWCLAVFAQHGLESSLWPAGLQEVLAQFRAVTQSLPRGLFPLPTIDTIKRSSLAA